MECRWKCGENEHRGETCAEAKKMNPLRKRIAELEAEADIRKSFYDLTVKERDLERVRVDKLRAVLSTDVELHERLLAWRGIMPGDECRTCHGAGVRAYGSTATWSGGIGGQAITSGVCDQCWGSGDAGRPGVDLRKLKAQMG
jgi:hypothetical protein